MSFFYEAIGRFVVRLRVGPLRAPDHDRRRRPRRCRVAGAVALASAQPPEG